MRRIILGALAFGTLLVCGCADRAKKAFDNGVSASQQGDYD